MRPSTGPLELTLDLRGTPPDKVLSRLLGALERVSDDVTLITLIRDTPEYVAAVSSAFHALRQRGYVSDTSRFPPGVQRLRVSKRGAGRSGHRAPVTEAAVAEPVYVPPPPLDAVPATPSTPPDGPAAPDA